MQVMVQQERRRLGRRALHIEVYLEAPGDGGLSHQFLIHDISLNGMALQSESIVPEVGASLTLCMAATGRGCEADHLIEARVMHVEGRRIGVQFNTVGVHVLQDIQRLFREARTF